MKKWLFAVLVAAFASTVAQASYYYQCQYEWTETSYTIFVAAHWEYSDYDQAWYYVPDGWETVVTGSWGTVCNWNYVPDPPPPPGNGGGSGGTTPGYQPPVLYPSMIWVVDVDTSSPGQLVADLQRTVTYNANCDFNYVMMTAPGSASVVLTGTIPFSWRMGPFGASAIQSSGYVAFYATSACGDIATTGFTITRSPTSRNVTGVLTVWYFSQPKDGSGSSVVVPVLNAFNRTFVQKYITTSFDVPTTGGAVRYQVKDATDAIQVGPLGFLPGMPYYTDTWNAIGTSMGSVAETMASRGYSNFDQTFSCDRPNWYGPIFGFEPTVSASVNGFNWQGVAGMIPCYTSGATSSMVLSPFN